jgi:integrase
VRNRVVAAVRRSRRTDHEHLFFKHDGEPIRHLHYGWKRWRRSVERLGLRPRAPYKARHSFITWNLMIGKNPLWVAKQHGHSAHADAARLCELD